MATDPNVVINKMILPTKATNQRGRIIINSYLHDRESYTQNELDEYRISEGYTKERRLSLKIESDV